MVEQFRRLMGPYLRMARMMVGRAVVNLVNDTLKMQELQVTVLADEVRADVERFQNYGFTSYPIPGSEAVVVSVGGNRDHAIVIAVDDRRYRLKSLQQGEVAIYTDEGDSVCLKRENNIEVTCLNKLKATATNEIEAITKAAKVNASESCEVTSPAVSVNASASCTVNSPSVLLGGGFGTMRAITDERIINWLINHTHASGAKPDQALAAANVCTSIVKGA